MSGHANSCEEQAYLHSGLGYTTEPDYFEDEEAGYERSLSYSNSYSVFDETEMSHEHRTGHVANVQHAGFTLGAFRVYMPVLEPVSSDVAATVPPPRFTRFPIPDEPRFGVHGVDDLDNDLQAFEDGISDSSDEAAAADNLSMSEDNRPEGQENRVDLEMSEVDEDDEATTEEISAQVTSFLDLLEMVEGDCPICLGQVGYGPMLVRLPCSTTGSHAFHRACIGHWFENRSDCPCCRHSFEELEWEWEEWEEGEEGEEEEWEDDDNDDEESLSNELRQIGIPIPLQGLRGGDDAARCLRELENVGRGHRGARGADVRGLAMRKTVAPTRLGDVLCLRIVGLLDVAFILYALDSIRT